MRRSLFRGGLGVLALLLGLELVLRLLPVSTATMTGYHHDPLVLTYPSGHRWTTATGWDLRNAQRLQANNLGFASDIDFVPEARAVALVGDSYVEASMLDAPQRPAAQLAARLARTPDAARPVYGMGSPGSALLDYAERIRLASQRLGVRDFVVLMEQGDLRQSLCGSGNVHGPCLDPHSLQPRQELRPPPSAAKNILRHSALAQYVFGQLKLDLSRLATQAFPAGGGHTPVQATGGDAAAPSESAEQAAARERMVQAVAEAFFSRIQPFATGRLVLVVDGRRTREALAGGEGSLTPLMRERQAFVALARARGVTIVDAEVLYAQHWAGSSLSLDVGPYDRHLNALGIGLLMDAAAQALQ